MSSFRAYILDSVVYNKSCICLFVYIKCVPAVIRGAKQPVNRHPVTQLASLLAKGTLILVFITKVETRRSKASRLIARIFLDEN